MKDSGEQLRNSEGQRETAASPDAQSLPEIRAAVDVDFERQMQGHTETSADVAFARCMALSAQIDLQLEHLSLRRIRGRLSARPGLALFDADRLHGALEFHLADALRELALVLDSGKITGRLAGFAGDTVPGSPDKVRFQIKLMVDAPIRSEVRS